jgi:hypothetical protein
VCGQLAGPLLRCRVEAQAEDRRTDTINGPDRGGEEVVELGDSERLLGSAQAAGIQSNWLFML